MCLSCGEYKEVSTDPIFRLRMSKRGLKSITVFILNNCNPVVRPASPLEHKHSPVLLDVLPEFGGRC